MNRIIIPLLLLLTTLGAKAEDRNTVFNILRVPTSAHASALGGDNISIVEDDASLAVSNPALLASVSHKTVSFGYVNYMSGVGMYNAQYTHVLNDKATVGAAANYISYGTLKETTALGDQVGTFTPSDLVMEGILSYTLAKNFVGGIGAKFVYSKIGAYTSTGAMVDLGVNYYHPDLDLSLSFAVRNLGGQLSAYNDEYESVPLDVLLGATYTLPNLPFRLSLTFANLNDWSYAFLRHASLGVDVLLGEQFYIAGGINLRRQHDMMVTDTEGKTSAAGAGLSIGAGLLLDRFKLNVSYSKYHASSQGIMFNAAFNL